MRISADGEVTLANAGHVPPYINGKPMAIEGALPLGILNGTQFSVCRFVLQPGDRMVLASDGLAEAMNADGELFGFTRVQELVEEGRSAAEVANAVQIFGQEDDISIIVLTRVPSEVLQDA
jgi:serine phosphatase RsbU (regulator of sigma subunit)